MTAWVKANTKQVKKRKKIKGTGEKLPRLAYAEDDEESKGDFDPGLHYVGRPQASLQKALSTSSHADAAVSKLQMNMIQKQKSEQKRRKQTLDAEYPAQAASENDEFFNQDDDMYDKRLQ